MIGKLIELRSGGTLDLSVSTLYSILYRMEERGWVKGRWVEKAGARRRRFYQLTANGRTALIRERQDWQDFIGVMTDLAGLDHA